MQRNWTECHQQPHTWGNQPFSSWNSQLQPHEILIKGPIQVVSASQIHTTREIIEVNVLILGMQQQKTVLVKYFFLPFNHSHWQRAFRNKDIFLSSEPRKTGSCGTTILSEQPWIYEWLYCPLGCGKGIGCLCSCFEVHLFPFLVSSLHKWVVLFLVREEGKRTSYPSSGRFVK